MSYNISYIISIGKECPSDSTMVLEYNGTIKEYSIESEAWNILVTLYRINKRNPVYQEFLDLIWNHFDEDTI